MTMLFYPVPSYSKNCYLSFNLQITIENRLDKCCPFSQVYLSNCFYTYK